ncbi:indole-3-glycerol phosphate synthase TrpC [Brevibacillus fulvus]|uniref:Indole-3-glycerol phosphate synthase n=1 Tax=Brevibacillus fulvus TaxID=1125967 RepID=A0A939BNA7_9BACL|nr:indole-3-glycerol phosphate synthase TrpC [Brevibacillus fulvus]MBM7588720.1 indole-3-glycerol phosphate synthase [Brevibacillus fulvus]
MLLKIVETKQEEVRRLKAGTTMQRLLDQARTVSAPRGFHQALANSERPVSVIAEVKKASPSKGLIRADFDPLAIAKAYVEADVEAMSVLTDEPHFQGSLRYLQAIREHVPQPLLRKDFIIDELQIAEARAYGADCILLIAAILEKEQIAHFYQAAGSLGMDVLVEVHDQDELETVFSVISPKLLGINNRNLKTFQTDLATTGELIHLIPPEITVVSESGISRRADLERLQQAGARAVLVGEHFMRQADVAQAVIDLAGSRKVRGPVQ